MTDAVHILAVPRAGLFRSLRRIKGTWAPAGALFSSNRCSEGEEYFFLFHLVRLTAGAGCSASAHPRVFPVASWSGGVPSRRKEQKLPNDGRTADLGLGLGSKYLLRCSHLEPTHVRVARQGRNPSLVFCHIPSVQHSCGCVMKLLGVLILLKMVPD